MEQSFHHLLMSGYMLLQKRMLARGKAAGLTMGQPKVLDYLGSHDGVSQRQIAQACCIEPATLTSLLNRMEERGLVERRMLNGNRRTSYVFLTELGRTLQQQVELDFAELEENAFCGVSPEERDTVLRVLQKVCGNLRMKEQ